MSKKYLFLVISLVICSLCCLWASYQYLDKQKELNVRGQYTFIKTLENMESLSAVRLISPQGREINIYYDNGVWKMKEAAGYFISPEMLKKLYNMFNNSIITDIFPADHAISRNLTAYTQAKEKDSATGMQIKTFSSDGSLLDDVIIGGENKHLKQHYAKYTNGKASYLISSAGGIMANATLWLPSPLLRIDYILVNGLQIGDKKVAEDDLDTLIMNSPSLQKTFYALQHIDFQDIIRSEDFFKAYPDIQAKEIVFYLRDGLRFELKLYYEENTYFLQIKADTELVSKRRAASFVREHKKFYDGWIFVIDDTIGKLLSEMEL